MPKNVVKILGKKFDITEMVNPIMSPVGLCENAQNQIYIAAGLTQAEYNDTLLHEMLHVIDYTAQLELSERQVHAISSLLYGVMADNKMLNTKCKLFKQ